jgi:hypothetical protein
MIWQSVATGALAAVFSVALAEIALRLPFPAVVATAGKIAASALHVLKARSISDHWKEKAMLAYAGTTFRSSMKLIGLMLIVGVVAVSLTVVFELIVSSFAAFIMSWPGILLTAALASLYAMTRGFIAHAVLRFPRPRPAPTGPAINADRRAEL